MLDFLLRTGPYGDGFGTIPRVSRSTCSSRARTGSTWARSQPRLPEVLRTASGKVELAPEPIVADLDRLRAAMARERNGGMVLIGRRQLRSNNSWMHNLPALVKGKERCTLHIHPDDAERLGLADGEPRARQLGGGLDRGASRDHRRRSCPAWCRSRTAGATTPPGVRMGVASAHAGVNSNVLADESMVEPLSGNAVLNGIPVEVACRRERPLNWRQMAQHRAAAVAADHVRGV